MRYKEHCVVIQKLLLKLYRQTASFLNVKSLMKLFRKLRYFLVLVISIVFGPVTVLVRNIPDLL